MSAWKKTDLETMIITSLQVMKQRPFNEKYIISLKGFFSAGKIQIILVDKHIDIYIT